MAPWALQRIAAVGLRRYVHASAPVFKTGSYVKMNDPLDHATGLEKQELLAKAYGNDDPFDMNVIKRAEAGTKDNPTKIPSLHNSRIMGCICELDSTCVNWMWIHKGEPKRCECGYLFELTDRVVLDISD